MIYNTSINVTIYIMKIILLTISIIINYYKQLNIITNNDVTYNVNNNIIITVILKTNTSTISKPQKLPQTLRINRALNIK